MSETGRFGQPDIAWDHGGRHGVAKIGFDFLHHLICQIRATVEKRQDDAPDLQIGIQSLPDPIDDLQKLGNTFQGIVFALKRYQYLIGRRQSVYRNQSERGWRIDKHVIVLVGDHGKRVF